MTSWKSTSGRLIAVAIAVVTGICSADVRSATAAEPGAGGAFRFAASIGVPSWDPIAEARGFAPTFYTAAYDGLVLERSDGTLVPGLATEWEETDESITFTLREDVTFHDGTPFDAEAVVYNIDRAKEAVNANGDLLSAVDEVEIVSDHEVIFHLSERDPDLLNSLARMPGMMVSPNVAPEDIAEGVPAGTGPYRVAEFSEDVTVLERNPDYWDPSQQYADEIEFRFLLDPEARLNALLTGEVDAALLDAAQVASAESAGLAIDQSSISSVSHLNVIDVGGERVPELADLRVRQAIAHSIDREAWSAVLSHGLGEATSQFFPEGSPWHLDDWAGYEYDPDRARQLLAEAGVDGVQLEIHTWGIFLQGAQVLQQMLGEVGIELTIHQVAPGEDVAALAEGRTPMNFTLMSASHPETMWSQYFDASLARNFWGQVAPGAEEARAAVAAAPRDELDAAYREMLRVMYEQAWAVPIWMNNNLLGFDAERFPNVHGTDNIVIGVSIRELAPAE